MNTPINQNMLQRLTQSRCFNLAMWALVGALGLLSTSGYALDSLLPPVVAEARLSTRDVVGNLGGVPVLIPRHFANYVEYEGDPSWGEKRKGQIPERTYQSKLVSFGYHTRFPDMAGESSSDLIEDRRKSPASKTPWISVGINTGRNYPGDGFLDRRVARIGKSGEVLKYEQYGRLPNAQHDLTAYAATGTDPKTGKPYREDRNAHDLFIHRDKAGHVDAYIDCSNRDVSAPPCEHTFSLAPHMSAQIYVVYRRSQLANWREIQEAVKRQILGFKAPAVPTATTKP